MLKGQADKKKKLVWTSDRQFAFDSLREGLMQSMGFVIPDLNGQFVIECDECKWGGGRGGPISICQRQNDTSLVCKQEVQPSGKELQSQG